MQIDSQVTSKAEKKHKKHIRFFHRVLEFMLMKLPEGGTVDMVRENPPSGIILKWMD